MNAGPATKRERQRAIREIITAEPVGSQQELAERLTRRGFAVTQATVSRLQVRLTCIQYCAVCTHTCNTIIVRDMYFCA